MNNSPLLSLNSLQDLCAGLYSIDQTSIDYSEGEEAESYLRDVFQNTTDLSSQSSELESKIRDWSSEYHLTSNRANVLRCLNLKNVHNILELGCGCGSISRYLGEQGKCVDAIEGALSRAELASLRCKDLDNINFYQGNFNSFVFPENHYDAVLLVGVIEYAAMFNEDGKSGEKAAEVLLERVKKTLKPDGILVLALENRLGLKYLLGAGEDHLSKPYLGIYNYPEKSGINTYSRQEWNAILDSAGFFSRKVLLPFPDYKLPRVVISEDFSQQCPYTHSLLYRIDSRDYIDTQWSFPSHELLTWKGFCKAGLLGEMANSFIIVAANSPDAVDECTDIDFVHYSSPSRAKQFRTVTSKKTGEIILSKRSIVKHCNHGNVIQACDNDSVFIEGELLSTTWIESCFESDPDTVFCNHVKDYYTFLIDLCAAKNYEANLIDAVPSNIIVDEKTGEWRLFDLEWCDEEVISPDYLVFRSLFWFALHNKKLITENFVNKFSSIEDFISFCFRTINITYGSQRDSFISKEEAFHARVSFRKGKSIDISLLLNSNLSIDQNVEGIKEIQSINSINGKTLVRILIKRILRKIGIGSNHKKNQ